MHIFATAYLKGLYVSKFIKEINDIKLINGKGLEWNGLGFLLLSKLINRICISINQMWSIVSSKKQMWPILQIALLVWAKLYLNDYSI